MSSCRCGSVSSSTYRHIMHDEQVNLTEKQVMLCVIEMLTATADR